MQIFFLCKEHGGCWLETIFDDFLIDLIQFLLAMFLCQQKLDEINKKIIEDGLKPTSTVFLTQKEYLRNAIDECAATSNSLDWN